MGRAEHSPVGYPSRRFARFRAGGHDQRVTAFEAEALRDGLDRSDPRAILASVGRESRKEVPTFEVDRLRELGADALAGPLLKPQRPSGPAEVDHLDLFGDPTSGEPVVRDWNRSSSGVERPVLLLRD